MMRFAFAHHIQELEDETLALGSMVDKAISRAIESLKTQDVTLARQVTDEDAAINAARWELENHAVHVFATQAPMASDLRRIIAIIHIASELERMADYAKVIARNTMRSAGSPLVSPLVEIPRMAELCREQLAAALDAFVECDADRARSIARKDEEIDLLRDSVYRELLALMIADPHAVPKASDLLWIAHSLERLGDRITNVCERIIFAVTGEFEENAHLG